MYPLLLLPCKGLEADWQERLNRLTHICPSPSPAMDALTPALLCLGALGFLWGK